MTAGDDKSRRQTKKLTEDNEVGKNTITNHQWESSEGKQQLVLVSITSGTVDSGWQWQWAAQRGGGQ